MEAIERRAVAERHVNLIINLAKKLIPTFKGYVSLEELVSFGAEGAMQALERHEPSKGKIATYLHRRIVGAMIDGVRSQTKHRHNRKKLKVVEAIREELTQVLERPPLEDEIDQALKDRGYSWYFRPEVMARPVNGYEGWAQHVADLKTRTPFNAATEEDMFEFLLEGLDEEARLVAKMRIRDDQNMDAIGRAIGLSKGGASNRWRRIKAHLKERMEVAA